MNNTKRKNPADLSSTGFSFVVEARGIEPLSENSSSQLSPSADAQLNFPFMHAERQACIIGIP